MITIRHATGEDLPRILDIYNEVIIHTTAVYSYEPHTLAMRTEWFETKQQQGFPVLVASENNLIVGFCTLGPFRMWPAYQHTVENSIYVAAEARGKGVGKLLMAPLIDAAKSLGKHAIVAGIDSSNIASINLHQQFGFAEVAHFKEVGWKFDRWLDLKFLELILH